MGEIVTVEVAGADRHAALEAALQAVLARARGGPDDAPDQDASHAVPIRGEGEDLATLFRDLVDDLLAQLDAYEGGLHQVTLDGVLHRDRGGFVAWGYATVVVPIAAITTRYRAGEVATETEGRETVIRVTLIEDSRD